MKYFIVVCCALLNLVQSNVLPEYLKKYICRKSDPDYKQCTLDGFENIRHDFVTGIPELGVPPLDPYVIPYMSVNRTINDMMNISAVFKDIKLMGLKNTVIEDLKVDPLNLAKEIRYSVPWLYMEMDYDLRGQVMGIPTKSSGHFQGNFTDILMYIKASLKTYEKDGVEHFKVNKMNTKLAVGDGEIHLVSNNKEMQYLADLITKYFNDNSRRVLDVVSPILVEWTKDFFQEMMDEILAMFPASELLPA